VCQPLSSLVVPHELRTASSAQGGLGSGLNQLDRSDRLNSPPIPTFLLISLIQSSNWLKLRWWALALNVTPAETCSDHVC
jgi:hypothetical protein